MGAARHGRVVLSSETLGMCALALRKKFAAHPTSTGVWENQRLPRQPPRYSRWWKQEVEAADRASRSRTTAVRMKRTYTAANPRLDPPNTDCGSLRAGTTHRSQRESLTLFRNLSADHQTSCYLGLRQCARGNVGRTPCDRRRWGIILPLKAIAPALVISIHCRRDSFPSRSQSARVMSSFSNRL